MMLALIWTLAGLLGAVAIVHWLRSGQPVWARLGISRTALVPDVAAGVGIGALVMTGIFVVHLLLAQIRLVDAPADTGTALTMIPVLIGLALLEEVVFRSLMLNGVIVLLTRGETLKREDLFKREALAVLLCAILFGVAHMSNPGASVLSVISNALGGVMYSLAFLGTRRLWLPLGVHFAWNYFQGPVFGFLVSGLDFGGLFSHTTIGSPLLTGGDYGPEGGLIGLGFRFVVIGLVLWWCRRTASQTDLT